MRSIRILLMMVVLIMISTSSVKAQIWSPQLQGYNGFGTVFYPYGYYQGFLANGVANGVGTFYFRDGTIFQGNFANGWRNGPGVIAHPLHGFVTGCWTNGHFVGNCVEVQNPYQKNQNVENAVQESYNNFSEEADFVAISPEGYEIRRIDPNSQLGRQVLGSYSGGQ